MFRHLFTVLKALSVIIVLIMVILCVNFVQKTLKKMQSTASNEDIVKQLERDDLPQVQPGEIAFSRAKEFLAIGDLKSAKEKLLYVVNFHPRTGSAMEARRILGEMNLDRILSLDNMKNKTVHKVKRGDSFLGIAQKHKTTLDAIMFFNGLTSYKRLYPGDELVVMPLDFRVVIDLQFQTLTLQYKGEFVKEYILQGSEASRVRKAYVTKISGKVGYQKGKKVQPSKIEFRSANKVLSLKGSALQITTAPAKKAGEDEVPSQGFFLNPSDLEELVMILRVGNEVEIRPAAA